MSHEGYLSPIDELSAADVDQMFELLGTHYENAQRQEFDKDLAEKDWVILVRDEHGRVTGFSTQMLLEVEVRSHRFRALFSGDTIVDRRIWGRNPLPQTWLGLLVYLMEQFPRQELYWLLTCMAYRTYRVLPMTFNEFYPRHDQQTPKLIKQRIDLLSRIKFGDAYDLERGIVVANSASYQWREQEAPISASRLRDPHCRFFLEKNPGHEQGDYFSCLAPLYADNLTTAARKTLGEGDVTQRLFRAA